MQELLPGEWFLVKQFPRYTLSLPTFVDCFSKIVSFSKKICRKTNSNKNKQNKKISNTKNQNKRISNKNNSDKILKNYNKKYADKRTFSRRQILLPFPQGNF